MVDFTTQIPDCGSDCLQLLVLVYVALWLSLHWEILIMLLSQFPLTFFQTHTIYSHADWDDHDHLRDVPWMDIFKLSSSVAGTEFCE